MMILVLAGGVGGARMAHGLAMILPPDAMTVIVNTGDDTEHFGLLVCPDVDTVCYTLSGRGDETRGWGVADESWTFMTEVEALGGPAWFRLGDRDLAFKAERTRRMRLGEPLSQVTAGLASRLGVVHRISPMSDDPVRTLVETSEGTLAFHDYFVRRRCAPAVTGFTYAGRDGARPAPAIAAALADPGLEAVVIAPSNPWLSIDPILSLDGVREAIEGCAMPVVAVSPIIGGEAVKGPAAKIMRELGLVPGSHAIATHYHGLIDGLVMDRQDAAEAPADVAVYLTDTLMRDVPDRARLATEVLSFVRHLARA